MTAPLTPEQRARLVEVMAKRKAPSSPLSAGLPSEEPPWTKTDLMIVPVSARLELPMAGMSRYDLRKMGELVTQLGAMMVRLSHQHAWWCTRENGESD